MSAGATIRSGAPAGIGERPDPAARLEALCDPGSFRALRTGVRSTRAGERALPGDGVLAGAGTAAGRPIFCFAEDPGFMGGSLGEAHAETIVRVMGLAGQAGAPVVGFVESGGARLQEGHAALAGYGRIFRESVALSRRVPQVSIVSGISAGGGSYAPALTDFVVMTERARMFLTGPRVVHEALGEEVSMDDLGGPAVHGRNGVCQLHRRRRGRRRPTRARAARLPAGVDRRPAAANRRTGARRARRSRRSARAAPRLRRPRADRAVVDSGESLELGGGWARNMVTSLARIDGRPVGVIANQPWRLGGVIDAAAAEKAALFVAACDRFRLPLVVLVDTPGFMPGRRQEEAGVIRHGASLLRAFARRPCRS